MARETIAPDTRIDDGPSGQTDDPTPSFALSATEPGATFECRLDGGAWAACPSSMTTAALADGQHTLEARAVDAAGNTDPTPAARTFTVSRARTDALPQAAPQPDAPQAPAPPTLQADRTGPSVAVTGAPRDEDPVPAYTFAANEDGATFLCRIDGGAFAACTAPFALPGNLAEGEHAFEVLAVDRAGNRGTSVRMTFFVGAGCAGTNGFRSASVRGSGRGLAIRFVPRVDAPVSADIFQVSLGRKLLRERLIARYRGLKRTRTWSGRADAKGRRIADGFYFVRLSIPLGPGRVDTRRLVAQRVGGRWVARPDFYGRSICGLISAYKLERPVFGGPRRGPARISFRLAQPARVTVDVLRGRKVVKRLGGAGYPVRRTIRLMLPARGLRAGVYRFRLTAVGATRRAVVEASARRL